MKDNQAYDLESNHSVWWKMRRRKILYCSYCRPNRGENRKWWRRRGRSKPKYKDHR